MNRLGLDVIAHLAQQFLIATRDDRKQGIVDQLGTHPINHSMFMKNILEKTDGSVALKLAACNDYDNCMKWYS